MAPHNGWIAAHIRLGADRNLPCYEKAHSWGEFVFDFEFANAYQRHGLSYYPKLVSCVPFTPVPGPRLLAGDESGQRELAQALMDKTRLGGYSGAHILFLPPAELALLETLGWLPRQQLRYLWRNRAYGSFGHFLNHLAGKRRKNIKRERRLIEESGFEIEWKTAAEIADADWPLIFDLYARTYEVRGQPPYLNLACLRRWSANFPQAMQLCLARHRGELVAMAFFFRDGDGLYGRHWGASAAYHSLHFELCYYRGIEYCIEHGLSVFDAGVQGEHKTLRGFEVEFSHSAHWIEHPDFAAAISRYLQRERAELSEQVRQLEAHSAYCKSE